MSERSNTDKADERVSSESGLFISAEPMEGGGRLSASADDSRDSDGLARTDADASDDSGSGLTDALGGDSDASDSDASDSDASDSDGTDGGDSVESESGLGGENPLGLDRTRTVRNGDDKDTRDT